MFLSVPVAILANFLTPIIQKLIEKNSTQRAMKNSKNISEEYAVIKNFKEDPDVFKVHLFDVIITSIYLTTMSLMTIFLLLFIQFALVGDILVVDTLTEDNIRLTRFALHLISMFSVVAFLFSSLSVINLCRKAWRTIVKVRNFEEYEKEVNEYLKG